jgi:hypothetical protein
LGSRSISARGLTLQKKIPLSPFGVIILLVGKGLVFRQEIIRHNPCLAKAHREKGILIRVKIQMMAIGCTDGHNLKIIKAQIIDYFNL